MNFNRSSMVFNVLKATEGGMGQKGAIAKLKQAGIKATPTVSGYIGHTAVMVKTEDKRIIARAERILYGR